MRDELNEDCPMSTVMVTDSSFSDSVLNSDKPVLVDFWAEWCGPCKAIAPALEEMAQSMGDRVTVAKVNIDEYPQIAQQYGVRGIPTLILFQGRSRLPRPRWEQCRRHSSSNGSNEAL